MATTFDHRRRIGAGDGHPHHRTGSPRPLAGDARQRTSGDTTTHHPPTGASATPPPNPPATSSQNPLTATTYHNPCGERPLIDPDLGPAFQYGYRDLQRVWRTSATSPTNNDGDLIRDMRRAAGLTQRQLATAIGHSEHTVSCWERGLRHPPQHVLTRIHLYLNEVGCPHPPQHRP